MNPIGVNFLPMSIWLTTEGMKKIAKWLNFFSELNIEVLEISPHKFNLIIGRKLARENVQKLLDLLSPYRFKYTIHIPDEVNILDTHLLKYSLEVIKSCMELGQELDAKIMVLHSGYIIPPEQELQRVMWAGPRNITYVELSEEEKYRALNQLAQNLTKCCDLARDYGITIGLENGDLGLTHLCRRVSELLYVVVKAKRDNLGITLDIGHLYICSKALNFNFLKAMEEALPHTIHMHLSDNYGLYHPYFPEHNVAYGFGDLHLPLGWGDIPWVQVVNRVFQRYRGALIIELSDKYGEEGYRVSVQYLRKLIEEVEKKQKDLPSRCEEC
ncbi:MAG: hypothetical protein DRJ40_04795 [Thermoprotei archaeon]|nr:MAG: hypothetical protein DRJ40_04730 [Thermoprotei archaeon]RLE56721.1 MAG: hypothetical protein DRJ40_04795 [Thermoprotei archaeon]